jgi:integrative and conjugative element protein (TIGR02256 family)
LWTVTGETAGQRLALDELHEIQSLTSGNPPAFRVEQAGEAEDDGWLPVEISLNCENVPVSPGQKALAPREHATLLIPGYFPFAQPAVRVRHQRFAGLPYVLGGHQICLYHSDADWNPAGGMFGFIARLAAWYRRSAAGRLVAAGQPLHPPLAYPLFDDTDSVVIHPDLPHDFEPSSAVMVRRYPWRADVVKWLRPNALNIGSHAALGRLESELANAARNYDGPAFLGAVKLLHEPLTFEFPDNFPDLVTALSAQHVSRAELLDQLAQVWVANMLSTRNPDTPAPLHVVIGAPMRGFAGADVPDMHLAVWELDPAEALAARILTLTDGTGDADLAARLLAARADAQEWISTAPLAWAYVQEARRHIVTRRDVGRPAQWLLGKNVLVLGCGALGARIAEHCVRAGVSRLTVADGDVVGPGVLVRQPYEDIDIGAPKARQLAGRLSDIRPSGVEVVAEVGDVRRTILGSDSARPEADLIVDATASRGVSARIEWLRRTQQGRWPPVLTLGVGHACERTLGALALPHASGAGTDILQSFADDAVQDEALRDASEDFFADPAPERIFQPEIGCSEPTFTGSDPEVAAAAGQVLTWSLTVLSDYAAHRPVSPKSLFFARMPGDRHRPAHIYLDWPNDITGDDERSGYQIRIRAEALAQMRAEALMTARLHPPSWETGGILLGYFDDACRVVWITAAEGPSPDSERGDQMFRHGTNGVVTRVAAHHERSGGRSRFVGMWHTHPCMSAQASLADNQAMENLFVPVAAVQIPRRAVRLILGGHNSEWICWLQGIGQPEIDFQLFRRADILALNSGAMKSDQEH